MDSATFWQIIELSFPNESELDKRAAAFIDSLSELSDGERRQFETQLDSGLQAIRLIATIDACRLLTARDDPETVDAFLHWIVSKGELVYNAALKNPDDLADHVGDDVLDGTWLRGILDSSLNRQSKDRPIPPSMKGTQNAETLRRQFPKLSAPLSSPQDADSRSN